MNNPNRNTITNDLSKGFDYDLQVWFKNYIVQPCGHPQSMKNEGCCNANKYAGLDVRKITLTER